MDRYRSQLINTLLLFFLASVMLPACTVQKSPVSGNKRFYGYSWEEEVALGEKADKQIQAQYGVYDDNKTSEFVNQVGERVLQHSDMRGEDVEPKFRNTEFYFRLLDSPVVNAFALPGGYVYMTRGLMSHLNNEAQFAMVMGHEIAHVAARHSSQQAFQRKVGNIALIGGAVLGQEAFGIPGQSIMQLGGATAQLLYSSYSRDMESEADELGVAYSAKTGYKASEGADFFTTLQRMGGSPQGLLPQLMQSHPDPGSREERIPKLAQKWAEEGYAMDELGEEAYMQAIDGMVYGNDPRQGFDRNGVFYVPNLQFQFPFPEEWNLINQTSMVAVVEPEQGAVMVLKIDPKNSTPESSVREILNNESVTEISSEATTSNGIDAYQAIAEAQSQNGEMMSLHIYALDYQDAIYRFMSYTSAGKFSAYQSVFENTTGGFAPIEDESILSIKPVRLSVVTTDRAQPFQELLPEELPMKITPEEVALINQVALDDEITAGTRVKIPVQQ